MVGFHFQDGRGLTALHHMLEKASSRQQDSRMHQAELDADLLHQLARLESAQEVIGALHLGLSQDVPRARRLLEHYPAADYPLGEEMIALKEKLVDAMARYLSRHPD